MERQETLNLVRFERLRPAVAPIRLLTLETFHQQCPAGVASQRGETWLGAKALHRDLVAPVDHAMQPLERLVGIVESGCMP